MAACFLYNSGLQYPHSQALPKRKLFQYHMQAMESWAGPGNEARFAVFCLHQFIPLKNQIFQTGLGMRL